MTATERAISALANKLRIYGEAHMAFGALYAVDKEEAINNLDRAFEACLEGFHTLYDVSKASFDYFEHADTTLLITLRNAIHHGDHELFHSLHARVVLENVPPKWIGAAFLLARDKVIPETPFTIKHYYRLDDFATRMGPASGPSHLGGRTNASKRQAQWTLIERSMGFAKIWELGAQERYPNDQVYLDVGPILIAAIARAFKELKAAGVQFKGFDAEVYEPVFTNEVKVDFDHLLYRICRVGWSDSYSPNGTTSAQGGEYLFRVSDVASTK